MGLLKRRVDTKAIKQDPYAGALVLKSEEVRTRYSENVKARQLLAYCVGLPITLGDINATVATSIPVRLYRMEKLSGGPKRRGERRLDLTQRRALGEGKLGSKAAEWAAIGGDVVEVTEHRILDMLNRPSPHTDGMLHNRSMLVDKQHFGETFEGVIDWKEGACGVSLQRLAPPYTEPNITEKDGLEFIESYTFKRDPTTPVDLNPDFVGHYMMARHLTDPWHGRGFLESCYLAVHALNETESFQADEAKRGFRPALAITTTGMNDQQKRDADKDLAEKLRSGIGKALRILWLNNPASSGHGATAVTPININHRELQSIEMIQEQRKRVLAAYGVPESMYEMNDANLASSVSGNRQYLDQTIRPMNDIFWSCRTNFLVPFGGEEPGVYFLAADDPTDDITTDRVVNMSTLVGSGIRTLNEAREELKLKPVEGGDIARINGVPLDEVGNTLALPGFGVPDSLEPEADAPEAQPVAQQQKIEETALNGAQIAQLVELARQVQAGELPKAAGLATAEAAFPGIPPEKLAKIFNQLIEGGSKPTEAATPAPEGEPEKAVKGACDGDEADSVRAGGDRVRGAGRSPSGQGGVAGEVDQGGEAGAGGGVGGGSPGTDSALAGCAASVGHHDQGGLTDADHTHKVAGAVEQGSKTEGQRRAGASQAEAVAPASPEGVRPDPAPDEDTKDAGGGSKAASLAEAARGSGDQGTGGGTGGASASEVQDHATGNFDREHHCHEDVTDPYAPCPCCAATKDDDDFLNRLPPAVRTEYLKLVPIIGDLLKDMEASSLDQIRSGTDANDLTFDGFEKQVQTILGGPEGLAKIMLEGAQQAQQQVKPDDPISFDVVPPSIEAEVDKYLIRLSSDLSDHTKAEIVRVVDQGVQQGQTIKEIADGIEQTGIGSPARAERIARTEVQNAVQTGRMSQFKELGIEKVKFITAPGARAAHKFIEMKTRGGVPIGKPVVGPGSLLGTDVAGEKHATPRFAPPWTPYCRCSAEPVF